MLQRTTDYKKKIKVSVVNYALLESVKNLKKVNENSIKELLTISKNDTSKIAEYFQYNNPGKSVELTLGKGKLEQKMEDIHMSTV